MKTMNSETGRLGVSPQTVIGTDNKIQTQVE